MKNNNNPEPSVFVILLNWNSFKDTIVCLRSLGKVKYKRVNILVVDNNSSDNSVFELEKFKADNPGLNLEIVKNNENSGFAGGCNVGIRKSLTCGADYVLLLNNDTEVSPDFISPLLCEAEKNKKAGIISPAIFFYDERELIWFGGKTKISWLAMDKAISSSLFKKRISSETSNENVNFLTGACMLIKKETLREIGEFDERFFLYFEDADLSLRAREAGWLLVWTPYSKIWHKVSATTLPSLGSAGMHYYHNRNIMLLAKKHGPIWVKFYMHVWAFLKIVKQLLKITARQDKEVSCAIIAGIRDYYKNKFGKMPV
ncbi:MAG: glycosyltransferase family 2 protein [Candidatus Spechtbacterales bacterium]